MSALLQTNPVQPARPAPVSGPGGPEAAALAAAQEFEAVFLAQMLQNLTGDLSGEGPLGGDQGDPFRHMLGEEIAKLISRAGGVGVGDAILKEMLKLQELA
jgi:peptidoglycan hydrolase FlgJ